MTKNIDRLYCAKCRNRATCQQPCTPVELLLKSVTTKEEHDRDLPREFTEKYKITQSWPESVKGKKKLICELFYLDGRTRREISLLVSAGYKYVCKVIAIENRRIRAAVSRQQKIKNPAK